MIKTQRPFRIVISAGADIRSRFLIDTVSRTAHHHNIGMNRHRYYESPTIAYNFRTTFKAGSDYNILIISSDAQTCMARYVPRHSYLRLCPETLAIAWSRYFSKVEIPTMKPAVGNPTSPTKFYPKNETQL